MGTTELKLLKAYSEIDSLRKKLEILDNLYTASLEVNDYLKAKLMENKNERDCIRAEGCMLQEDDCGIE